MRERKRKQRWIESRKAGGRKKRRNIASSVRIDFISFFGVLSTCTMSICRYIWTQCAPFRLLPVSEWMSKRVCVCVWVSEWVSWSECLSRWVTHILVVYAITFCSPWLSSFTSYHITWYRIAWHHIVSNCVTSNDIAIHLMTPYPI